MDFGSNWIWWLFLLTIGGIGYAVYSSDRKSKSDESLQGLSGWLILVGLGLVLSPIRLIWDFLQTYLPIFTDGTVNALITPTSATYNQAFAIFIFVEVAVNIALFAASIFAILLFFSKKKVFPRFFVILYVIYPVVILLDALVAGLVFPSMTFDEIFDFETSRVLILSAISSTIWISYMLRSRRVELTFIV